MSALIKFMDVEYVLLVTRNFRDCKSVVQFSNEKNNVHVILEESDSAESHQKYCNFRMEVDKSETKEKHRKLGIGGVEGIKSN